MEIIEKDGWLWEKTKRGYHTHMQRVKRIENKVVSEPSDEVLVVEMDNEPQEENNELTEAENKPKRKKKKEDL